MINAKTNEFITIPLSDFHAEKSHRFVTDSIRAFVSPITSFVKES